jgi:dTDP-4-dehydrorhamnose reductase
LGSGLVKLFPKSLHPAHEELDITDKAWVAKYIKAHDVDSIIHCAAKTDVRSCEVNRRAAYKTNVEGTHNLLHALHPLHAPYMLYVSTACVFDGNLPSHTYSEDDVPYPKNFYGLTKLLGEEAVKAFQGDWLIVRTNFIKRGPWPWPEAFVDRFGTYLYTDQVAVAVKKLVEQRMTGLVHIAGDTRISTYELARQCDSKVQPTTLDQYQGPPLTVNMCLRSNRIPSIPFIQR